MTSPLPRAAQTLLDVSRRLGVPVDLVRELPKKSPQERTWNFLDDTYVSTIFAVKFGEMCSSTEFLPGRIAIHEEGLREWDRRHVYRLESVFLHEMAHAVLGPDEELCTVWERDACRQLFSRRAYINLCSYSGAFSRDLRALRKEHRLRPGWSLRIRPRQEEQPDSEIDPTTPAEAP